MELFEFKTINELCLKITDGAHFSPSEEQNGIYPMYSSKDMLYNGFDDKDVKMISKSDYDRLVKQDCRPLTDDILIIKDGNNYLKQVFKVKSTLDAVILSSIAILRPNKKIIDPDYFTYVLRTESVRKAMANYVSGAAIPRVVLKDFKKMKLKLHKDINAQRHIASILSAYDNLIENNTRRICLLEQMAENLYKEWFVRFRFPGHEKAEFENGLPKGWNKLPLLEICEFKRGKNITSEEMCDGNIPVISAGIDVSGYHSKANVKGVSVTMSSSGANAGFISIHYTDIWAADCSYIEESTTPNIFYVYELLNNLRIVITNFQRGAAQPHVYPKDINRIKLIVPDKALMEEANNRFAAVHKEIFYLQQQSALLSRQRDLLLPRLMSGKLEVNV